MDRTRIVLLSIVPLLLSSCGFANPGGTDGRVLDQSVGFLDGVWHGTMVPFVLLLHFVMDVGMYAYPNAGWSYDVGFFLGTFASVPVGWATTLISLGARFFGG